MCKCTYVLCMLQVCIPQFTGLISLAPITCDKYSLSLLPSQIGTKLQEYQRASLFIVACHR